MEMKYMKCTKQRPFEMLNMWDIVNDLETENGIPVPTAWRVLGLRMEERPPAMEVSCEYIE
jgi:hypothetical protein